MQMLRIVMVLSAWCWFASARTLKFAFVRSNISRAIRFCRGSWRGTIP